jgi:hypothetical protein
LGCHVCLCLVFVGSCRLLEAARRAVIAIPAGAAVATVAAVAAVAAITTVAAFVAIGLAKDGRRTFFMFLDANGHVAQHIIVNAHLAFHFGDCRRLSVNVHQDIMRLPVLVDPVCGVAKTPAFDLRDLAAMRLDDALELFGKGFRLLPGNILARKEYVFVKSHEGFLSSDQVAARSLHTAFQPGETDGKGEGKRLRAETREDGTLATLCFPGKTHLRSAPGGQA